MGYVYVGGDRKDGEKVKDMIVSKKKWNATLPESDERRGSRSRDKDREREKDRDGNKRRKSRSRSSSRRRKRSTSASERRHERSKHSHHRHHHGSKHSHSRKRSKSGSRSKSSHSKAHQLQRQSSSGHSNGDSGKDRSDRNKEDPENNAVPVVVQAAGKNRSDVRVRELWIGNLPENISEKRLYSHFFIFGEIEKIEIFAHKVTIDIRLMSSFSKVNLLMLLLGISLLVVLVEPLIRVQG